MTAVRSASEVLEAIQKVKAGSAGFCTNFFPVQAKVESWVAHHELTIQAFEGVTFFLRKDRDFAHLYFCARNSARLGQRLPEFLRGTAGKLLIDIVGPEASLTDLLNLTEQAGFSRYSRLVRLARMAAPVQLGGAAPTVELANAADAPTILGLIEKMFDRFADQLPTVYEIEGAIAARQIFVIKQDSEVAALLFFETQGLTSTIRYWLVGTEFHSRGFGSALIRHYFSSQSSARRFILWVAARNENAIQKYQHYGYAPDGLVDHELVYPNA